MPDSPVTTPETDTQARPAGRVSKQERVRAERLQVQSDRIALTALGTAFRVANRAQTAVIRAYRKGAGVTIAYQESISDLKPVLSQAMILATLVGVEQQAIHVMEQDPNRKLLSLADNTTPKFSAAVRFLTDRLSLSQVELDAMAAKTNAHLTRVVADISAFGQRTLMNEMRIITQQNLTQREGVKRLRGAFERMGITPRNKGTLETVFRTQTQMAYAAGSQAVYDDPDIDEILWGYKYVTVGDDRVRAGHIALDGVTLPKSDPFWQTSSPPNGMNCRCSRIALFDPRNEVRPPSSIEVDGKRVKPGPDDGFAFNPGRVLGPPQGFEVFAPLPVTSKPRPAAQAVKPPKKVKTTIPTPKKVIKPPVQAKPITVPTTDIAAKVERLAPKNTKTEALKAKLAEQKKRTQTLVAQKLKAEKEIASLKEKLAKTRSPVADLKKKIAAEKAKTKASEQAERISLKKRFEDTGQIDRFTGEGRAPSVNGTTWVRETRKLPSQSKAIVSYTSNGYEGLRDYKTGKKAIRGGRRAAAELDRQLAKAYARRPLLAPQGERKVFRGMANLSPSDFKKYTTNDGIIIDKSWQSSSTSSKVADGFSKHKTLTTRKWVRFEIKTTEGMDISGLSSFAREREIILPPGVQYRITGVKLKKGSGAIVQLTEV